MAQGSPPACHFGTPCALQPNRCIFTHDAKERVLRLILGHVAARSSTRLLGGARLPGMREHGCHGWHKGLARHQPTLNVATTNGTNLRGSTREMMHGILLERRHHHVHLTVCISERQKERREGDGGRP